MAPRKTPVDPIEIASGVYCLPLGGVNVFMVLSGLSWVLIDTGWRDSGPTIRRAAQLVFGPGSRPRAILLTHPHGDHVGSAVELSRAWNVPAYMHADDLPLLSGDILTQAEPPEALGRFMLGLMRWLPPSMLKRLATPHLANAVRPMPGDEEGVPGLPDWECVHTPGHSPGHISFFRPGDKVLIVGDALRTTPLMGLVPWLRRITPPLRPASWNWQDAKDSVATLAKLEPRVLASGHGMPMRGPHVSEELRVFAERFARAK